MKNIISAERQRGEVASFLTIVSMVVLSLGLLVGYQINRNTATINPAPQAAAPAPSRSIPVDGVDQHDEVCYPGGDKNQQVRDKYCRTRMYPALLTRDTIKTADTRAKQVFSDIFKGTEQTKQNPLIVPVTERGQSTLRIYGGLCLNRSSVEGKGQLSTEDVEVYISLFGVRKFYDDKGAVGIENKDINDVLRYKIAAAEDKAGSNNTDELFVSRSREEVCTFGNGKTDPNDYLKTDNPLLFNIRAAKASIESAIKRAEKDPSLNQKFDKEACEVYIHLRDNIAAGNGNAKPKDTYNIYKISLRDVLGDEANVLCPPVTTPTLTPELSQSPTPTIPVSGTPTSSPTPTKPNDRKTPTPTPQVAQCFERCNPSVTCGIDPFTGKRMSCYDASGLNINPPVFPTKGQNDNQAGGPGTRLPLCENGDSQCLCLPQKCQTNPESCTNSTEACEKVDGPTPTVTTTGTVTPTVVTPSVTSPTPPPLACEFDALAYVQECAQMDPKTGQCKRGTDGRFIAKAIGSNVLTSAWGASNNKQIAGGRYGTNPATPFAYLQNTFTGAFDRLKERFPYLVEKSFYELSYLDYHATVPLAPGKNPLQAGSAADLTDVGRSSNPILIAPLNQYPKEQYFNFESAQVRLFADLASKGYRVVPEGNEIADCRNSITGSSIGACDRVEFDQNRVLTLSQEEKASRDPRDTVAGLRVGCGQNIVYGWTVQKCNTEPADYLFVMDVSTSMSTGKDLTGTLKIDAAKNAVNSFIDTIKTYSKDSRAGLIQFSSPDNTKTVQNFTPDLESVKAAVNSKLTIKQGTCIENGLQETIRVLKANVGSSNRKTYVVFLTDGLPNCPNGTPTDKSISLVGELGTTLRGIEGVTTYAIGFGDPQKEGVGPDVELFNVVKLIASNENQAYSTSRDLNILEVYQKIEAELNSCAKTDALYANFVTSQDINGDGVINTIDLFLIYDNYFARGQDVPEDLNGDQIVNSLDVSIIVNNLGKTVPQENNTAQKSIGDVFN